MTEPAKVGLLHPEREALAVLRKSMRNPDKAAKIIDELLKDQAKELAYRTLKQLSEEVTNLLAVSQAFADTTKQLMRELNDGNPES